MSGTGYQRLGEEQQLGILELNADIPLSDGDSAENSQKEEQGRLEYFSKLKSELERLQKVDDGRKQTDKHTFGF